MKPKYLQAIPSSELKPEQGSTSLLSDCSPVPVWSFPTVFIWVADFMRKSLNPCSPSWWGCPHRRCLLINNLKPKKRKHDMERLVDLSRAKTYTLFMSPGSPNRSPALEEKWPENVHFVSFELPMALGTEVTQYTGTLQARILFVFYFTDKGCHFRGFNTCGCHF